MTDIASPPAGVAAVFDTCADDVRTDVLSVRALIYETASETEGVGPLDETLKWGQPSYLTSETGSGSTIRIAPTAPGSSHDYAVYFICSTTLVESFKALFGDTFTYDGERALLFKSGAARPDNELRECLAMALTYHLHRKV